MAKRIALVILYILQCYIVVTGRQVFGRDGGPFLLFGVSLLIAILSLHSLAGEKAQQSDEGVDSPLSHMLTGFSIGCAPFLCLLPVINNMFHEFADYSHSSDVITQLDTLFTRWKAGIFPYYPLEQYEWHPYPVYMPLNWLPLAIPHWLHIDVRWVGILFLATANGIWGGYVWTRKAGTIIKLTGILLPPVAFIFFAIWARFDISVSLETLIAAYYLLLATGLAWRKTWLIATSVILCLLSRYTVVFWLPLFAVLLWMNEPSRTSLLVWGSVIAAVFLIYLMPFYFHDPTILSQGIRYHNGCAIAEWQWEGAYTFDNGIYFAPYMKNMLPGPMEEKVWWARAIQAALMTGICVWGILYYRRKKASVNFYDLCLAALYLTLLFFYMFSPLLYRYYYIVLLTVSAVMIARALLNERPYGKNINPV